MDLKTPDVRIVFEHVFYCKSEEAPPRVDSVSLVASLGNEWLRVAAPPNVHVP